MNTVNFAFALSMLGMLGACGQSSAPELSLDAKLKMLQTDASSVSSQEAFAILKEGAQEKGIADDELFKASIEVPFDPKTAPIKSLIEMEHGEGASTKGLLKSNDIHHNKFALGQLLGVDSEKAKSLDPELWTLAHDLSLNENLHPELRSRLSDRLQQKHQSVVDSLVNPIEEASSRVHRMVKPETQKPDGPVAVPYWDCSAQKQCQQNHSHAAGVEKGKQDRLRKEFGDLESLQDLLRSRIARMNSEIIETSPRLEALLLSRERHMGKSENAQKNIESMNFILESLQDLRDAEISNNESLLIKDVIENIDASARLSEVILIDLFNSEVSEGRKSSLKAVLKIVQSLRLSGVMNEFKESAFVSDSEMLTELAKVSLHLDREKKYRDIALESVEQNVRKIMAMNELVVEEAKLFLEETQVETDQLLGKKKDMELDIQNKKDEILALQAQIDALIKKANACTPVILQHNHMVTHGCKAQVPCVKEYW